MNQESQHSSGKDKKNSNQSGLHSKTLPDWMNKKFVSCLRQHQWAKDTLQNECRSGNMEEIVKEKGLRGWGLALDRSCRSDACSLTTAGSFHSYWRKLADVSIHAILSCWQDTVHSAWIHQPLHQDACPTPTSPGKELYVFCHKNLFLENPPVFCLASIIDRF